MSSHRNYPPGATIHLAAREDSKRFEVKTPTNALASIPAMNAEQARELAADGYRGFGPEDFEVLEPDHDFEPGPYPSPVESGRAVTEHDLWMLQAAMYKGKRVGLEGKYSPRKNPTEYTIDALLEHFGDAEDVPLHDSEALQQAPGIGPDRAAQVVGAAVADGLIERPIRRDSA